MNGTQVTVVGNIISQITQRQLDDGTVRASFRIASTERRFDRASGQWVDGGNFYVQVTCWRRLAENVVASLTVGDPVTVAGRLYTHEYESEGQSRSMTSIDAFTVAADLTRCRAVVTRNGRRPVEVSAGGGDGADDPAVDRDPSPDRPARVLTAVAPGGGA